MSPLRHTTVSFNDIARGDPWEYVDEPYNAKTRLVAGEDGIILCSFVSTQYKRVTDRQTNGQKCCRQKTALSIAARCSNYSCMVQVGL